MPTERSSTPSDQEEARDLQGQLSARRREISTDAYSMSVGELVNLYRDEELDVHPEFQRVYRWTDDQKSKLIESLLLGIPMPSIFVAQTEDGTWDVVDGVQRLSTILELQGALIDDEGKRIPPLVLRGTRYLPDLAGRMWDHEDAAISLTQAQRLDIRRAKVDLKIIKRDSSPTAKYDLFQRLNAYGTLLEPQELRSCLLISVNRDFYYWLLDLSRLESFQALISLSDRLKAEQFYIELALRFILFRSLESEAIGQIGNVGEYLTDQAVRLATTATEAELSDTKRAFEKTFDLLAQHGGEDVFRKYDVSKGRFMGAFLSTAFEAMGLGAGYHIDYYASHADELDPERRAIEFWSDPVFASGGFATGKRARARMMTTVTRGRALFDPLANDKA